MLDIRRGRRVLCAAMLFAVSACPSAHAGIFLQGSLGLISKATGTAVPAAPVTGPAALDTVDDTNSRRISSDGRYVVFLSEANGLSAQDNDDVRNVYVRDTQSDTTTFVSRATGVAGAPATADAAGPTISADGSRVAWSTAAQLESADTDAVADIYVRDLAAATTVRASDGGAASTDPELDGDGDRVVFTTAAALDATKDANGVLDVYLRDLATQTTTLVSRATGAATNAGGGANPSISDNGNRIAFTSASTTLHPDDTSSVGSVFLRDVQAATTELVSRFSDTVVNTEGASLSEVVKGPAISGDGTTVAFDTTQSIDPSDTNPVSDVYVRTLAPAAGSRTTTWASRPQAGVTPTVTHSTRASLNADGMRVAFGSTGRFTTTSSPGVDSAYVRDLAAGTTYHASRITGAAGASSTDHTSHLGIAGDGRSVVFDSDADNLSNDDDNASRQIFVRRLADHASAADATLYVSRPSGTDPFTGTGLVGVGHQGRSSSHGGRYVVFTSASPGLVPGQAAGVNVFVRDVLNDTLELANLATDDAAIPDAALTGAVGFSASISEDGRYVAFATTAPFGPQLASGIYVRDRVAGSTLYASRRDGPAGAAIAGAARPSLSLDGRRVAFTTTVAADPADTGTDNDVYVRDLGSGATIFASRNSAGTEGNASSNSPQLDGTGRRVVFTSGATNLHPDDAESSNDVFLRDIEAGTTELVSRGGTGDVNNTNTANSPDISADGTKVAFVYNPPGFPGVPGGVLVRDRTGATTFNVGGTISDVTVAIAAAGDVVAFEAEGSGVDPGAPASGVNQVYVRDLGQPAPQLAGRAGLAGAPADRRSWRPRCRPTDAASLSPRPPAISTRPGPTRPSSTCSCALPGARARTQPRRTRR